MSLSSIFKKSYVVLDIVNLLPSPNEVFVIANFSPSLFPQIHLTGIPQEDNSRATPLLVKSPRHIINLTELSFIILIASDKL